MACDLALWGKGELALDCLKRAVDEGFWGYELLKEDEDFASIRGDPAFQAMLPKVKERYAVEAPKHARDTLMAMPKGQPPPEGWPVLLFLHGYGAGNESYAWVTKLAAAHGFVGLAPSGLVLSANFYGWPGGPAERTHKYLQPLLEKYRMHKHIDLSRLYLCGFSQGATIAAGLVAAYPQTYAGAIALSPGGTTTTPPGAVNTAGPRRPLFVTSGRQESLFVLLRQKLLGNLWRKANWPFREEYHPGGHEFPAGWETQFPEIVRWLVEQNNGSGK
jgi:predicted esterase